MTTTKATKLVPKYQQVASWVMRQVDEGHFKPGEKIHSIRELCDQFSVGDVTVKTALRYLTERGVIRTIAGSGAYVCDPVSPMSAAQHKTVGLMKIGMQPVSIYAYGIDLLQQQLQLQDYTTLYSVVDLDRTSETAAALRRYGEQQVNTLIVFPAHREPFEQSPQYQMLCGWRGAMMIFESRSNLHAYVTANIEQSTFDMTQYLYGLGHRRICLATAYRRKVAGFRKAIQQINDPSLKHWILGQPGKTDKAAHTHGDQILSLTPRPTAVMAGDDHAAAILVSHFLHAGLRVPEDISVTSFNDEAAPSARSPIELTTVRHPCLEIAQEVARWVQLPQPPREFRREISGSLILRDSTAPPGPPRKFVARKPGSQKTVVD